jgi:cell division protein ZapA (FtsZ GTPase activity inhibitor)
MPKMDKTTEITITVSERLFTLELPVQDEEFIEAIADALKRYLKKRGSKIKIRQAYVNSLEDSTQVVSKVISKSKEIDKWRNETGQFITTISKQ